MKKNYIFTITILLSAISFAASVINISGKWNCDLKLADGNNLPLTYNFTQSGEKLTGVVNSPQGDLTIEEGKLNGCDISFYVNVQGMDIPHHGKIYTDSIAMDVVANGDHLHSVLLRSKN